MIRCSVGCHFIPLRLSYVCLGWMRYANVLLIEGVGLNKQQGLMILAGTKKLMLLRGCWKQWAPVQIWIMSSLFQGKSPTVSGSDEGLSPRLQPTENQPIWLHNWKRSLKTRTKFIRILQHCLILSKTPNYSMLICFPQFMSIIRNLTVKVDNLTFSTITQLGRRNTNDSPISFFTLLNMIFCPFWLYFGPFFPFFSFIFVFFFLALREKNEENGPKKNGETEEEKSAKNEE